MTKRFDLIVSNVRLINSNATSLAISNGRIAAIGCSEDARGPEIDGKGATAMPGLVDHHIHLLATAAQMQSVDLGGLLRRQSVADRLHSAAAAQQAGQWLRATGYDERSAGLLDAVAINQWVSDRPVRIQGRTGALWMLNSAALALMGDPPYPDGVETGADGAPTGRLWRCDDWLRQRIATAPPPLVGLGQKLLSYGITAVTDAGADNGPGHAAILGEAVRSGDLPQRLTIMGREDLPSGVDYQVGPLKLLYDESDWPDAAVVSRRIGDARQQGRAVAAHCTTTAELLLYLAALDDAGGARAGDRIEHGSMIPHSMIPDIASAGLMVVTQPGFVYDRGDRYLEQVPDHERADLYRLRSLMDAGIALAAGSDAPYANVNPWIGIQAAQDRLTPSGATLGPHEAISAADAMALYSPDGVRPSGTKRANSTPVFAVGQIGDLCLRSNALSSGETPDGATGAISVTIIGGNVFEIGTSEQNRLAK